MLIATGEIDTITTLLCNKTAAIKPETLERLVTMSLEVPAYREPLVHRADLPPDLARRLYMWVGEALQSYLAEHYEVDDSVLETAIAKAIGAAARSVGPERSALQIEPSVADAPPKPDLALLRALAEGDLPGFKERFAAVLRLPISAVTAILDNPGRQPLAVACKGCGLERQTFSEILCHLSGLKPPSLFAETDSYGRSMRYFDRIERSGAEAVLASWRRTPNIEWLH